ncbi:hypothetical protein D1632_17055 [Chryseobacterium nematophagum]|uniref:Stress-response A/B barrel domain-containing protein n=2 Tax=Chryseobacterium nematophagum TaxID=2305228 RepID=A0A3M7L738_9FLAO|nr:hypothetical protein D1632_17055 [Chryseobacterium nematophagum]
MRKINIKNFAKSIIRLFTIICFIEFMSATPYNHDTIPSAPKTQEAEKIEHLVLFKFKPSVSTQQRQEVVNRFMALSKSLKDGKPYLKVEYGIQNSKSPAKGNYDVGFRVTFNSITDRDYYVGKIGGQPDPQTFDQMHDDFKSFVGPLLDLNDPNTGGVLVFDFKSNEKENDSIPETEYRLDHWTLFRFKPSVTQAQKQKVIDGFLALKNSKKEGSPYIKLIDFGYQNSKEGAYRGYEVAFRISFTSEADRDYYEGKSSQNAPGTFDAMHDAYINFAKEFLDIDPDLSKGIMIYDYEVTR